ncbi:phosphoribosylanthranilate isomerase [Marinimicrococcus flavescens]|uniref:N-(5'-phosphoribosyl)anthranilate isomerase n=1 Tax=Marinimicrococcus flavescens TaxID=3031815 RepID=A0AAP3XSL5_9PROT|nr:phosphoribosylanthranilate isomerase [Marinimicrococcus flavescens]
MDGHHEARPAVKVCGLTQAERIGEACALGASYVGFVFFPPSPRALTPEQAAELAEAVKPPVKMVGVFVDAADEWIDHVLSWVPLDVLQLHGHESPARVRALATRTGCRVMKALRIEEKADLESIAPYAEAADMLLFDAKPPRDAGWPGGHGLPFDWTLLEGLRLPVPWALAGGLTAGNLEAAVRLVRPPLVDVSSGIEERPGIKDPAKLQAFLKEAARLRAADVAGEGANP